MKLVSVPDVEPRMTCLKTPNVTLFPNSLENYLSSCNLRCFFLILHGDVKINRPQSRPEEQTIAWPRCDTEERGAEKQEAGVDAH